MGEDPGADWVNTYLANLATARQHSCTPGVAVEMDALKSIGLNQAEEPPIQLGDEAAGSSLIDDSKTCESLRRIVARITRDDPALEDDAMQECRIRLWRLASEHPGKTKSWYLQSCRFHLQHWLASGHSVDSRKRAPGDRRITIDPANDQLPVDWYHTNEELIELVSAHDIVSTLACRLEPCERAVLGGLADGLVLREVAAEFNLSYPTALKCRRRIAALTIRLGISPPARPRSSPTPRTESPPRTGGETGAFDRGSFLRSY